MISKYDAGEERKDDIDLLNLSSQTGDELLVYHESNYPNSWNHTNTEIQNIDPNNPLIKFLKRLSIQSGDEHVAMNCQYA